MRNLFIYSYMCRVAPSMLHPQIRKCMDDAAEIIDAHPSIHHALQAYADPQGIPYIDATLTSSAIQLRMCLFVCDVLETRADKTAILETVL